MHIKMVHKLYESSRPTNSLNALSFFALTAWIDKLEVSKFSKRPLSELKSGDYWREEAGKSGERKTRVIRFKKVI